MTRSNHTRRRDVRAYMAEHGMTYTEALRELTAIALTANVAPGDTYASPFRVRPVDQGGPTLPAAVTREHDVNHVCGHWLGNKCDGCGTCTTCDGCYCGEWRAEAEQDAYDREVEREHAEHRDEPGEDCPTCDYDRTRTKNFTECPKCHKKLTGYGHFLDHCPPVCRPDKPHPRGLDWSHLVGKRITIDNDWLYHGPRADYASTWTGTVTGWWRRPSDGAETKWYELQLNPTVPQPDGDDITSVPFDPRDWTITEH